MTESQRSKQFLVRPRFSGEVLTLVKMVNPTVKSLSKAIPSQLHHDFHKGELDTKSLLKYYVESCINLSLFQEAEGNILTLGLKLF